tara:strand:+ start:224 stop:493 length:270 start_codon:yes stop_codon:yes gene_type:complete
MTDDKEEKDEIENIKRKKAEELLKQHHEGEVSPEVLSWSFRFNLESQFHEIVQNGERLVAITQDANWANLICDLLNSVELAQQVVESND